MRVVSERKFPSIAFNGDINDCGRFRMIAKKNAIQLIKNIRQIANVHEHTKTTQRTHPTENIVAQNEELRRNIARGQRAHVPLDRLLRRHERLRSLSNDR